jgi:hypothetical protein
VLADARAATLFALASVAVVLAGRRKLNFCKFNYFSQICKLNTNNVKKKSQDSNLQEGTHNSSVKSKLEKVKEDIQQQPLICLNNPLFA